MSYKSGITPSKVAIPFSFVMAVYLPIVTVCPVYRMSDLNPSGMDTFTCTVNACVALSSEEHAAMITVTAANIIFVIKEIVLFIL